MKLVELLDLIDENEYVRIVNDIEEIVSVYDGKNSVDDILLNKDVIKIYTTFIFYDNVITIMIADVDDYSIN